MKKKSLRKILQNVKRKNRGITLIALVLTIVILIILATVTINFAFGENGLVSMTEETKDLATNSIDYESNARANLAGFMNEFIADLEAGSSEEETEEPIPEPEPEIIPVTGISINPTELEFTVKDTVYVHKELENIQVTIEPENTTNKNYKWQTESGEEITEDMILHNDPGGITCVAVSEDNPEIKVRASPIPFSKISCLDKIVSSCLKFKTSS